MFLLVLPIDCSSIRSFKSPFCRWRFCSLHASKLPFLIAFSNALDDLCRGQTRSHSPRLAELFWKKFCDTDCRTAEHLKSDWTFWFLLMLMATEATSHITPVAGFLRSAGPVGWIENGNGFSCPQLSKNDLNASKCNDDAILCDSHRYSWIKHLFNQTTPNNPIWTRFLNSTAGNQHPRPHAVAREGPTWDKSVMINNKYPLAHCEEQRTSLILQFTSFWLVALLSPEPLPCRKTARCSLGAVFYRPVSVFSNHFIRLRDTFSCPGDVTMFLTADLQALMQEKSRDILRHTVWHLAKFMVWYAVVLWSTIWYDIVITWSMIIICPL